MHTAQELGLLTWLDALKVATALLTPLLAVWARQLVENHRERHTLEKLVGRTIGDEPEFFDVAFEHLDKVVNSVKAGTVFVTAFDIPEATLAAAARLCQLDPKHAHIYASYRQYAQLASTHMERLQRLQEDYFKRDGMPPARLVQAIELEATSVKRCLEAVQQQDMRIMALLQQRGHARPDPRLTAQLMKAHKRRGHSADEA